MFNCTEYNSVYRKLDFNLDAKLQNRVNVMEIGLVDLI